jgi:hypothetical protein
LTTSYFGRGIGFNSDFNDRGGFHIIQSFLSLDESEEADIAGRAARQGCSGTYECILSEDELEKLNFCLG